MRGTRALALAALAAAAVAQDPGAGVLTLEAQAGRALAEGRPDAAVTAYLALARAEPEQARWVAGAVEALVLGERFQDALELLDTARQRFPDGTPGHVELRVLTAKVTVLHAEHLAAGGRRDAHVLLAYQEAADLAREVVDEYEDNRDARLILAEAEFALEHFDQALVQAKEAAARFPTHPGGHILVAKVMYQRFVAARRRIAAETPKGKELAQLASDAAAARKATTAAIDAAIAADPSRAFPHKLLGDVHAWNDNAGQAIACYARALGLDPGAQVDHDWLASATKPEALIALYRQALADYRARPGADARRSALVTWHLGKTLFQTKQFAAAREQMRAALAANRDYTNSLYYLWLSSYWLGEHDAAEQEAAAYAEHGAAGFADLLRSLPDRGQTLPILGFLAGRAYAAGRARESCALNHVLALVENTAQAWNNYAFLCRETGRHQDSLAGYERALDLEPQSPQLLNDAAVILHYHLPSPENLARAKSMYLRAVALAEQQLAGGKLDEQTRARTEQARKDAEANLEKLR